MSSTLHLFGFFLYLTEVNKIRFCDRSKGKLTLVLKLKTIEGLDFIGRELYDIVVTYH